MQDRCEVINIFSVILNLEDTASSAYAVVADSFADGEEILENVQEYEILSVEPLVRCRECKHSRTDDVFGGRWCQLPGSIKRVRDEFFCADGERKDDADE